MIIPRSLGAAEPETAPAEAERPSLFLSCADECFEDYLRQELNYFDFSRDPHRAEIVAVITRQPAGNGGERFTVRLEQAGRAATSSQAVVVPAGATDQEKREKLMQLILRLLLKNELRGGRYDQDFELRLPKRDGERLSRLVDPWDYWVFSPEIGGTGEGGSGYHFVDLEAGVTVRRVTESEKLRLSGGYGHSFSGYLLEDGSRINGSVGNWHSRALYAHSIAGHFALGGVVTGRGSEYENLQGHVHGGPLAEWNFFPYSENASQQLRLAYQAGPWLNWYWEPNTAGVMNEARPYHALSLIADANQAWGSLQWIGQVNQFLDDPALYRLSTGAIFTLRLYEGLAVSFEGEAAFVQDLINLRGRPITDEELLLWTAQQPTDFLLKGMLTLSYTFGSIHNTIVNPRFARVDLEDE